MKIPVIVFATAIKALKDTLDLADAVDPFDSDAANKLRGIALDNIRGIPEDLQIDVGLAGDDQHDFTPPVEGDVAYLWAARQVFGPEDAMSQSIECAEYVAWVDPDGGETAPITWTPADAQGPEGYVLLDDPTNAPDAAFSPYTAWAYVCDEMPPEFDAPSHDAVFHDGGWVLPQ